MERPPVTFSGMEHLLVDPPAKERALASWSRLSDLVQLLLVRGKDPPALPEVRVELPEHVRLSLPMELPAIQEQRGDAAGAGELVDHVLDEDLGVARDIRMEGVDEWSAGPSRKPQGRIRLGEPRIRGVDHVAVREVGDELSVVGRDVRVTRSLLDPVEEVRPDHGAMRHEPRSEEQ